MSGRGEDGAGNEDGMVDAAVAPANQIDNGAMAAEVQFEILASRQFLQRNANIARTLAQDIRNGQPLTVPDGYGGVMTLEVNDSLEGEAA